MPLQATSGAASYDAFGGGPPAAKINYIEDFFQSYLRTGTGASATITTGLDGSTKETLVWTKSRSAATNHKLTDNVRGVTKALSSNTTDAEATDSQGLTAFSATGYTIGTNTDYNNSGATYVDWQWVAQPKFFDVVTYTGTGSSQAITHNLGSTPGCIITKSVTDTEGWSVYHRSLTAGNILNLSATSAEFTLSGLFSSVTSSSFTVGTNSRINSSGQTFIAYLFAHDAGGFGLTGTDNVISCGSFTTNGSGNATVSLGYEPQWLLIKNSSAAGYPWYMFDSMRGLTVGGNDRMLQANLNFAEENNNIVEPSATGFSYGVGPASNTFIYITIRRGPMKVPTLGTSVFAAVSRTGTDANAVVTAGFPPDFLITKNRFGTASPIGSGVLDRMRPLNAFFTTSDVTAEDTVQTDELRSWNMTGVTLGPDANTSRFNWSANTYINYMFRRAAGYFDEACYTGTGSNTTQAHNLTIIPELIFVKRRNASGAWQVYSSALANTEYLVLDSTAAKATGATRWNSTTPTSSVFSLGTDATVNASGGTYIAYLFASAPTVSKVGSYTGTGTTKQIDCGFTAGARFVLIKRTDSTGDWYVWDSIRGIVSGNDPYILLNSGAAEDTTTDYIDTYSAGFEISSTAPSAINASAGTFLFLAIA